MKIEKKVLDMSLAGIFTAIIIAMVGRTVSRLHPVRLYECDDHSRPGHHRSDHSRTEVRRLLRTGIWCDQPRKSDHYPWCDLLRIQSVRYDRRIQRKHVERRDRDRAACMHRHRCLLCI